MLGVSPGFVTILGALLPASLSFSRFETVVPFAIAGPDPVPLDLPASVAFECSRLLSLSEPLRQKKVMRNIITCGTLVPGNPMTHPTGPRPDRAGLDKTLGRTVPAYPCAQPGGDYNTMQGTSLRHGKLSKGSWAGSPCGREWGGSGFLRATLGQKQKKRVKCCPPRQSFFEAGDPPP